MSSGKSDRRAPLEPRLWKTRPPTRSWALGAGRCVLAVNPEHVLRTRTRVARPLEEVFAFFADAENLERITPPELNFRIVTPTPLTMVEGTWIDYRLALFRFGFVWKTQITLWRPPHEFVDVQEKGPYAQWIHRHTFRAEGATTVIEDEVRYRLPIPILGEIAYPLVRLQLGRIFKYRERRILEELA